MRSQQLITLNDPKLVLSNYSVSQTNGTLTISPAALSLTADNQTKRLWFSRPNPVLTGELTGVVNGDNLVDELLHDGGHPQGRKAKPVCHHGVA